MWFANKCTHELSSSPRKKLKACDVVEDAVNEYSEPPPMKVVLPCGFSVLTTCRCKWCSSTAGQSRMDVGMACVDCMHMLRYSLSYEFHLH